MSYRRLAMTYTQLEGLAYVSKTLLKLFARCLQFQRCYKDSSRLSKQASSISKHAEVFAARPQ